jgi:hypothetical protein
MSNGSKRIALAASAIIIFTAGIMGGMRLARAKQASHATDSSTLGNTTSVSLGSANVAGRVVERSTHGNNKPIAASPAEGEILRNIRDAMILPQESRTTPLLIALEQTTKIPLSKALLDELRRIVDEGEIESSHFVLSLMEQREEKSSVDLLMHAATHQNPDVADRALFALEAVAGTVFKNREEATIWAAQWKPDAERIKLFDPNQENDGDNPIVSDLRLPGPRGHAPKDPAQKQEEK